MEALRIISNEHHNLWALAVTIEQVVDEIEAGAPVDRNFFDSVFDYIDQFVEHSHHRKEEEFLFRHLRQRAPEAASRIDALLAEHHNEPEIVKGLRQQLNRVIHGTLDKASFLAALRKFTQSAKSHMAREEREAISLARSVLTASDWAEIDAAFLDNNDPLFGDKAEGNFRELFHRVVSLAPDSVGLGGHSAGHLQNLSSGKNQAEILLSVSGMESCYGRIKALKGISLEVRRGETVALVGANGAGKSTFLRTLSGVQAMSAGRIHFDGEDISKLRSDLRMRRGICQSPEGRQVFGPLSIEDNLRLGAYTQPKHQVAGDLEKVFSMFPILKEKRHLPAGTLSGGQQQMLAIGRALMGRPKMLLLDEPSMGLAPLLVEEVFNVVRTLKAQGMTIFLVEQNAFAALAIADRGYVLETGQITLSGSGQELSSNEQVRAAYLGM